MQVLGGRLPALRAHAPSMSEVLQGTCLPVQNGDRVALSLSPAQVHALQHAGPVHGIHAPSPSLHQCTSCLHACQGVEGARTVVTVTTPKERAAAAVSGRC